MSKAKGDTFTFEAFMSCTITLETDVDDAFRPTGIHAFITGDVYDDVDAAKMWLVQAGFEADGAGLWLDDGVWQVSMFRLA